MNGDVTSKVLVESAIDFPIKLSFREYVDEIIREIRASDLNGKFSSMDYSKQGSPIFYFSSVA